MAESWRTRLARWRFNWFPAYRATGARIEYIARDWLEVRVRLPLSRRTRNYVGTTFGGSMYGALDPIFMIMLMRTLGPDFVVWDKAATIRFLRPGRATLRATFRLSEALVAEVRDDARASGSIERDLQVDLADADGQVHATCTKTLHVRWKPGRDEAGH
jgi:acyl-coenzyme A thioesterase PaaI-like protein